MKKNTVSGIHMIAILITALSLVTTVTGLLYETGGTSYAFTNQFGDTVKLYGNGLYAHDSYFKAPIFRGTDLTILCLAVPLLILATVLDIKKRMIKTRLFLTSILSIFTYYSASIAFGVTYNFLQLVYIALFSLSLFGLILAITTMDSFNLTVNKIPKRGVSVFLILIGVALIAAWLPDIITSLVRGRALQSIEVYTTEITYVIDMGIVAPSAIVCLRLLNRKRPLGYILLAMLLSLGTLVGVMLPVQTLFQLAAGIEISAAEFATKVGSFVLLAIFALYLQINLYKGIQETD